jgi:hypothetical protein
MKHKCLMCGTEEEPNAWFTDNGVDDEEAICEFCFLNLRKVR